MMKLERFRKLAGSCLNHSRLWLFETIWPGLHLGDGCRVRALPRIKLTGDAQIVFGRRVLINSSPRGYHTGMAFPVTLLADRKGARITIGDDSRLHGCCIHAWSQVRIGRGCLISAGVQIVDAQGHPTALEFARLRTRLADLPEPIEIGDYCWLCSGALILKGVHLGEGCIVAANSVVTSGDYPPFSLLSGVPARVVRTIDPALVLPADSPVGNLPGSKITWI